MRTDALVDRLSQNLRPVRPRSIKREALLLVVLGAIEVAAFVGMGFMRPDMPVAMETPSFWWKLASTGLIAILGAGVALMSADPVRSPRRGLRWILACVAVIFATGWLIDAAGDGVAELVRRLDWTHGIQCVWKMAALSIPPAIALGGLIRRAAPTDRSGTALAAGLSSAAWGAFVFVFACPSDDPLYIAVWYTVGCAIVTVVGRAVLLICRDGDADGDAGPPCCEIEFMNQIGNPTSGLPGPPLRAGRRLHPWPLRIMHWVNAVVMLIMITSGWGIYDDDVIIRGFHFGSFWRLGDWAAWSLNWHFAGMWFLVINGLIYLIYGFVTGRFRQKLLPIRPAEVVQTVIDTLHFKIAHEDLTVYNAVQKLLYIIVILAGISQVITGLAIWKPIQFSGLVSLLGGFQTARVLHFAGMAVIVGFLIVHVALALLVPKTLWAMVAGGPRVTANSPHARQGHTP